MTTPNLPAVPGHWRRFESPITKGLATSWKHALTEMTVLRSLSTMKNGERWIHVSVALPRRLPSWEELTKIKNEFLGRDANAIQVLASDDTHVNIHYFCLHVWQPLQESSRLPNLHDLENEEAI